MADILSEYSSTILVDVYLSTVRRFATRDFYSPDRNFYKGTLKEFPSISKSLSDLYYGVEQTSTITLIFANIDDGIDPTWDTLAGGEELRDVWVRIQRYDVVNILNRFVTQAGDRYITQASDYYVSQLCELTFECRGKIVNYKLGTTVELVLEIRDDWNLETLLPQGVITTADFTATALDLGQPINICFGHCRNVPLRNIQNDNVNNLYDYLIGYGTMQDLWIDHANEIGIHRRDSLGWKLVDTSEYTFYDGSSGSLFPGYATIRFTSGREQRDFSGGMCEIAADVYGMESNFGVVERNFAYTIKSLLSNTTWGLSDSVNNASFAAAAAVLDGIGNMYCDGAVTKQQQARDILDDLLFPARASLERNNEGEWIIEIDEASASVLSLGENDGFYNNAEIGDVSITPASEALKTAIVQYFLNPLEDDAPIKEKSLAVHTTFGVIKTYTLPFVLEDDTATKVLDYLKGRSLYSDRRVLVSVGMEGRDLLRGDVITLTKPTRLLTADEFKIESITRGGIGYEMDCREYNALIYA